MELKPLFFDEIDTGVSGKVATKIGEKIEKKFFEMFSAFFGLLAASVIFAFVIYGIKMHSGQYSPGE